jgi:Flp pilus assembly pilin Flp
MYEYLKTWLELKTDRRAVTMLEYAIMGSIIAAALVIAVPILTGAVNTEFGTIAGNITTGAAAGK